MSYVDFIGRTADLSAFQGLRLSGIPLDMTLASEVSSGELVTGILKLAQRFLLMFFTEQGSVAYLPGYGTEFMQLARQGFLRTELDVRAAFAEAVVDIADQMREDEQTSDPDDEKYQSATLLQVVVEPGFVSISCHLLSQAGESRRLILPLSTSL